MRIPFNKPFIAGKELYYIARAVLGGHLSGGGYYTKRCHEWLEKRLGCVRAFLTHSCTDSLEMAAVLCDIQPGDEVIMPSFTFVSTANAFVLRGAIPVFVDIRPDTLNIDEKRIDAGVSSRSRAIVPVHYAGVGCAMEEIMAIAQRCDLLVIEDAAQGFCNAYQGRYLGTIGHLGCLSFHETKNIITGEGGALLVNEPRFVERAEIIWEKGTDRSKFRRGEVDKYTWVDVGSSFSPSELIGAFLYAQLELEKEINEARSMLYRRYLDLLRPLEQQGLLKLPPESATSGCIGHIFHILTQTTDERAGLISYLQKHDIQAVFHYVPLHSSPAGRKYGRTCGDMSVTNDVSERLLRLPIFYEMTGSEVMRVSETIHRFYGMPFGGV
ncbi:MAG: dTDP-4-amino-4,6-dideoxygalactose transaminase [Deltaproteobacteria bacterium]|nr:dTDP-4-amino-4,6-dideoxygalactose transaminase [Deltaproteobacteria bacterium]